MMIFRNKKWVVFNFLPYEHKSLEDYLEKMALRGWILENIKGYYLKFRKDTPKKLRYSVDVLDSISFMDGKDTDKALEYREYCKEAGWEFVCERNKIQVYCSELDEERIDIHTDEVEKFNTVRKASLKYVLLNLITIICLLLGQYIATIGSYSAHFLANPLGLGTFIFVIIFSLHEIMGLITFLIFNIKGKISINNGKKVSYNLKKISLVRRIIYCLMSIVLFIAWLSFAIESDVSILKIVIILVFLVLASNYIINFIKNKNIKNKKIIIQGAYLVLTLAIFFTITNMIFRDVFIKDYNYSDKMLNKVDNLKIEDFNDVSKEDSLYFRAEKTPVAAYLYYGDEGEKNYLSYEIFESKYKWVVEYNFNKRIKFVNKIGVEYIEKKTSLPKGINVYMNEHGHRYTIISQNKMVEISSMDNVSEEELINVVYEKLFISNLK